MREGDTFSASDDTTTTDAEKKKILYIVEAIRKCFACESSLNVTLAEGRAA